jgi:hypothetical protein
MAKKKIIYKSVLRVEILSEEPLPDSVSLDTVNYQITDGDWSGALDWEWHNAELHGAEGAKALMNQGSDPEFFQMDEDGNEI